MLPGRFTCNAVKAGTLRLRLTSSRHSFGAEGYCFCDLEKELPIRAEIDVSG